MRRIAASLAFVLALAPFGAAAGDAPVRILAFGDSLSAGFGLPPDEGFVPALDRWLAAHGHPEAQVLNAGLSGDTTYGGRVRIGWALRQRPDIVLVEIGANDMLLGWSAAKAERNLDAILAEAGAGGRPVLLLGIAAHGEPGFRAGWDAMWARVAARHGAALVPDLYATIRAQPGAKRAAFLQRDRLHASPKGVATMVELAGPKVLELIEAAGTR